MESSDLSKPRFDVHRAVTDKIVAAIEAGAGTFVMPWHSRGAAITRPTNAHTGMGYRGVNVVALWAEATLAGYGSGTWASYRQWQQRGAQVRKGEHGTTIVFYREIGDQAVTENEEGERRFVARASSVFNADQVDGWKVPQQVSASPVEIVVEAEAFVAATGAEVRHGGDIACYWPGKDFIQLPDRDRFVGTLNSTPTESYYAVLLHELTHWTGAAQRLNRPRGTRFGDRLYATEELVAELGAAFLCADLGITNEPRPDHAAYVEHWLQILKEDARAVFAAAREATKAATYLHEREAVVA